ncbi:hypothetical protein RhiirA5_434527 [Rhizophagus irregularis]|uniref:DUF8211 domain-containing protein n=4 Tax=Rhizophagus irregularis TaxID=588596 RepID=A0A2N0NPY5_9GLOM|nr:hypothetical protein RhiirA5_434527 [Rhizophagus irregularis]
MSSTPYIEIDWSSTSQHSYVQLGDPTPPENNSDDISYNTERPVTLSAKDILSLDIDDIYPYTYSTLHFEDNETENIYDDEDYFQQLLQANLNAEIEEVSVLRNDKPLVDNTPLTPIQEINPIPPLDTTPLLENLPIVENITPIPPLKRHFHFRIYIPCPFRNNPEHFHNDTPCGIPTPFIMSHNRRSCVMHQRTFSQKHCFKDINKKDEPIRDDIPTDFINDKSSHANLLYYRWLNGKSKRITSRRLGISYNSNIQARDFSTTLKTGIKHMYRKCLNKFERNLSPNLRTQKQQDIRFKRSCRRVFNKMRLPSNRKATNQDYLAIARKHHFIFMNNQWIKIPIRHLLYKQCDSIPNADDYSFLAPYFATNFNHKQQIMTKLTKASSSTGPSAPPVNYNPIPDVFIPKKYHDIIPKDPIYVNNCYVVPGSREWFTYMYNVDESYYPPESSTPRYNAKGKYIARTPIYRSGVVENYVPSFIVEKSQLRRMEKIKEDALTKEAAYHGTTFKHYNARANTITSLTDASFHFHERTPSYLARRLENHNLGFSNATLDKNHNKGLKKNNLRTQGAIRFPTHQYIDVSDDTAEVEYRPNKCDNINNENHYFSFQDHNMKRLRPSPDTTDDSLVPGPSSSKTI